ncbi:MAG: IS110 family transposase [Acidimicrobiales bacterium]
MAIAGGLDVHRRQITFDYIDSDSDSDEVRRGKIVPATREGLRVWLSELEGQEGAFALEGCTGWRYVTEELGRAGFEPHVAEPADTSALRGPKRRAKTDRADARHLRELLVAGGVPESWVPPALVQETRTTVRLHKALVDERSAWQFRIHAVLFHQGAPEQKALLTEDGRARLKHAELSGAARQAVEIALRHIGSVNEEIDLLRSELVPFSRRQPGCRALQSQYGVGPLNAVAIWAELGDCQRFSSSADAVRHTGLDITVHSSDTKRCRGRLARQGRSVLRRALFEAAKNASWRTSPDHDYHAQVKDRLGGRRAALAVARKIARRSYHILRNLGDEAFAATD